MLVILMPLLVLSLAHLVLLEHHFTGSLSSVLNVESVHGVKAGDFLLALTADSALTLLKDHAELT